MALTIFSLGALAFASGRGHEASHGHAEPAHDSHQAHENTHEKERVKETPSLWVLMYDEFRIKLDRLRRIDEQNEQLRQRVAELEVENARLQAAVGERSEAHRAEKIKDQARHEGGVEVARTIASLDTGSEKLLSKAPKEIFSSAMKSFETGDYESSGKAFAFLSDEEKAESFHTAQTFYLAGVSLYKVNNFKKAHLYFERSKISAQQSGGADLSYAPRSLAWIALCHAKLGDKQNEQRIVQELIQKYPKSKEARRFNRHD